MEKIAFRSPTHEILAAELGATKGRKLSIVDYGCGEGELLNYIPTERIASYRGWEVNVGSLMVAREKWKKQKKFHWEEINRKKLPNLGANETVDVLFLIGVIQYLPKKDWLHVLKEAKRVLKPEGQILISCAVDHAVYRWFNIYRLFLPNHFVSRDKLISILRKHSFLVEKQYERGIFFTPFFSNVFVFFFDAIDKMLFRTSGELGPVGRKIRAICSPLIRFEMGLPIDFGYTLFAVATKRGLNKL